MSSPSKPVVGLIGCGKMGGAMARGWLASKSLSRLHIYDNGAPDAALSENDPVGIHIDLKSFQTCLPALDMLVLAVKPQAMKDLCESLNRELPPVLCVLSIAAGKPLSFFQNILGGKQPVIRAMPNTPAFIGKGITIAVPGNNVGAADKILCETLMKPLGMFDWVDDEALMDAVTALSGSGPAYLFYLIETMAEAGKAAGLPDILAENLARQTVIGAAALADHQQGDTPSRLRENVTSPNGTTAAALSTLMDGRLQSIMTEAVQKAADRSRELSQ